jgi:hypothetical protein
MAELKYQESSGNCFTRPCLCEVSKYTERSTDVQLLSGYRICSSVSNVASLIPFPFGPQHRSHTASPLANTFKIWKFKSNDDIVFIPVLHFFLVTTATNKDNITDNRANITHEMSSHFGGPPTFPFPFDCFCGEDEEVEEHCASFLFFLSSFCILHILLSMYSEGSPVPTFPQFWMTRTFPSPPPSSSLLVWRGVSITRTMDSLGRKSAPPPSSVCIPGANSPSECHIPPSPIWYCNVTSQLLKLPNHDIVPHLSRHSFRIHSTIGHSSPPLIIYLSYFSSSSSSTGR